MINYERMYVSRFLYIGDGGYMKPVAVELLDVTKFEINRIMDEWNTPPEHTGGVFTRKYKVIIKR